MTTETAIVPREEGALAVWKAMVGKVLTAGLSPALTEQELDAYAIVCQHLELDPFKKEIYALRFEGRLVFHIAIDGWLKKAEETGLYAGVGPLEWCGSDEVWKEVWLSKDPPAAARATIYRKDWRVPAVGLAKYDSFVRLKDGKPMATWAKMPDVKLAVCALSQAIRRAFPAMAGHLSTQQAELEQQGYAVEVDQEEADLPELVRPPQALDLTARSAEPAPAVDQETGEITGFSLAEADASAETERTYLPPVSDVQAGTKVKEGDVQPLLAKAHELGVPQPEVFDYARSRFGKELAACNRNEILDIAQWAQTRANEITEAAKEVLTL